MLLLFPSPFPSSIFLLSKQLNWLLIDGRIWSDTSQGREDIAGTSRKHHRSADCSHWMTPALFLSLDLLWSPLIWNCYILKIWKCLWPRLLYVEYFIRAPGVSTLIQPWGPFMSLLEQTIIHPWQSPHLCVQRLFLDPMGQSFHSLCCSGFVKP